MKNAKQTALKAARAELAQLPVYSDHIPLVAISNILATNGLSADLDGIYCGHEGTVKELVSFEGKNTNHAIVIQWYRMSSGRLEITSYLS